MENQGPKDAHYSKKIRAGKRTYYFDVKSTRANDYYITITESKRKPGESEDRPMFEKHKLFLYKEDFEKFTDALTEVLGYIRENGGYTAPAMSENTALNTGANGTSWSEVHFDDLGK